MHCWVSQQCAQAGICSPFVLTEIRASVMLYLARCFALLQSSRLTGHCLRACRGLLERSPLTLARSLEAAEQAALWLLLRALALSLLLLAVSLLLPPLMLLISIGASYTERARRSEKPEQLHHAQTRLRCSAMLIPASAAATLITAIQSQIMTLTPLPVLTLQV